MVYIRDSSKTNTEMSVTRGQNEISKAHRTERKLSFKKIFVLHEKSFIMKSIFKD